MIHLAQFSIRRPKLTLAVWGAFAAILVVIGLGVSDRLSPTMTFVPGTESTRAEKLAEGEFGPTTLVPILLTGPPAQLNRQGPPLVRALKRRDDTRVLSAWDAGEAGAAMRPSKTEAMILASVARTEQQMVDRYQRSIDRTVDAYTSAPCGRISAAPRRSIERSRTRPFTPRASPRCSPCRSSSWPC